MKDEQELIDENEPIQEEDGVTPQNATATGKNWETGLVRGKANPISNHGDWESGVTRGKANPVTTNENALEEQLKSMKNMINSLS